MTNLEPVHALNMDANQQQSFARFYRSLPQKPTPTVRFFNHADYYTVHGEDATMGQMQVFCTNVVKYMGQEPKLSYLVLNRGNFEKFVRELLLVKQYRVEVYVKPNQSHPNTWLLEYKGSPGNLSQFENVLFENNDIVISSAVMGVKLFNAMLAISCANTTENQFYLGELKDNEFFTELEALIAQISPKECVIPSGETQELVALRKMLERNGVLVIKLKSSEFAEGDVVQDLNRLLYFKDDQQRNANALPETTMTEALGALQAVIKYLNLTADNQNFNQFKLNPLGQIKFVRLDNAAIYALNLLPKPGMGISNKHDSVFGVLDFCCTTQGRRLLEQWLRQPLRDLNLIRERQEVIECLFKDAETRNILISTCLPQMPDLLMLAKRLGGKKATLQDCYRVYQALDSTPNMIASLRNCNNKSIKAELVEPLADVLADMEKYQSMVEQTLDMNMVERGDFLIQPSYDDELNELCEKRKVIEEKIQKLLSKSSQDLCFDSAKGVKLDHTDQHGYIFRVTQKEEHLLRRNKEYQIVDAIKGGVRFTNQKLSALNESYSEIQDLYENKQKNVVQEILEIAAGYGNSLKMLNMCIAKVDVFTSLAHAAAQAPIPFVRPKMLEEGSGVIRIKKARHPCLEKQESVSFIPNDVTLKGSMLHIITGPNMGGKSTYMKSIGVCVLLAHVGSLIPCEEAEISIVDCVLTRVGADDSELKGLSTFMMEMVETCGIVRSATSKSLVIIDELGRGTSTYDGCGIAYAIAEHLIKEVKCFTLFSTHFHEITRLAELIPGVENYHVTAVIGDKTITPLYQIREGACDKSYGIHCAKMADFPDDVIDFAVQYQKQLEEHQGMSHIKLFEAGLKQKIIDEGDLIIKSALEDIKKLDVENMSDAEILDAVEKVKCDLQSQDNLFVKGLIDMP